MKTINTKTTLPIALFLGTILLTGCIGGFAGAPNTPEGVVRAYVSEMNDGNIRGMMKYVVDEEAALLDEVDQRDLDQLGEIMRMVNVEITSLEVLEEGEETALIEVELTMSGSMFGQEMRETQVETFPLVKENGQWKIGGQTVPGFY